MNLVFLMLVRYLTFVRWVAVDFVTALLTCFLPFSPRPFLSFYFFFCLGPLHKHIFIFIFFFFSSSFLFLLWYFYSFLEWTILCWCAYFTFSTLSSLPLDCCHLHFFLTLPSLRYFSSYLLSQSLCFRGLESPPSPCRLSVSCASASVHLTPLPVQHTLLYTLPVSALCMAPLSQYEGESLRLWTRYRITVTHDRTRTQTLYVHTHAHGHHAVLHTPFLRNLLP